MYKIQGVNERFPAYSEFMSTANTPRGRAISVRLPEDLRKRIEMLAAATSRSQGDVVREVVERAFPPSNGNIN